MSIPTTEGSLGAPESLPLREGAYTVQQESSELLLHQQTPSDQVQVHQFLPGEVGPPPPDRSHQQWRFTPVAEVYTIRQRSSNRFLDAHETPDRDFSVVTRGEQRNDTQRWVALSQGLSTEPIFNILHLSSTWFLDAHEAGQDFSVVLRSAQNNDSQRWRLHHTDRGDRLEQVSTGRFMDAYQNADNDFSVVTRTSQNDDTQRWILNLVGGVYTIQNLRSGRFLDAHQDADNDFRVVTRMPQSNNTQRWAVLPLGGLSYSLQQLNTSRFLDAHASGERNAVTRDPQGNNSQRWEIRSVQQ